MRLLPLHALHEAQGGRFVALGGWSVPAAYGDAAAEAAAVRGSMGVVDISARGKLRLSGPDRISFLQGLISNDVALVTDSQGVYATVLNPKGRILADLNVYHQPDALLLDTEPDATETLLKLLTRYLIAAEAVIEDVTGRWGHVSLQGPAAGRLLREVSGAAPPQADLAALHAKIGGAPVTIIRLSRTGEDGYDLLAASEHGQAMWEALLASGKAMGLRPYGYEAAEILRIEAGLPRAGVEMDETTFPQEARIEDRAVSFTKGCFVGQEPVSRIHHRAHDQVNRRLTGFLIEGETAPERGAKIVRDDLEVGVVMSAVASPTLKRVIALGYLKREWWEPGTAVVVMSRGTPVHATVAALPFYGGATPP